MIENVVLVQFFGGIVVIILANYFAMKYGLNGLRENVVEIKVDVKSLLQNDAKQDTDIALNKQSIEHLETTMEQRGEER